MAAVLLHRPVAVEDLVILPSVIAEEALALLEAFVAEDADEVRFRATLLLTYARDAGLKGLALPLIQLLEEVERGFFAFANGRMSTSLEKVIAAAADVVANAATASTDNCEGDALIH